MIRELLQQAGFTGSFLLPLKPYTDWVRRRKAGVFHPNTGYITDDALRDYPWANAWALCFLAYPPNGVDAPVSSSYIPSNALYHLTRRLEETCREHGVRAVCADVPIRTMAAQAGVGVILKNAQLAIPPYGSRVSLQALLVDAGEAPVFDTPPRALHSCEGCDLCMRACPTGAIGEDGFHWRQCMRAYMDDVAAMPLWAKKNVRQLLGCEICQNACPVNAHLRVEPLPREQADALRLERLLADDTAEARRLVGKNITRRRFLSQAALIAANTGRADVLPLLAGLSEDADAQVRMQAIDAISCLQGEGKPCTMDASHQAGS